MPKIELNSVCSFIFYLKSESNYLYFLEDFFKHKFFTEPLPPRRIENNYYSPRAGIPQSVPSSHTYGYKPKTPRSNTGYDIPRNSPRPSTLQRHGSIADRTSRAHSNVPTGASPVPSTNTPTKNLSDSQDFTFLPPLNMGRQQHIQYSNGTAQTNDNPVKQVQVHASANVRGVPVPSQRTNFMLMEERRNSSKSPVMNTQRAESSTIPSIQNLTAPETKFIINELPTKSNTLSSHIRRYTTTDLASCVKEEESTSSKSRDENDDKVGSSIPKSATTRNIVEKATSQEDTKLNPPVDNIQYLSTSPSRTSASATVKIISPSTQKASAAGVFPSFSSDEEDEGENDRIPYPTGNNPHLESSSSQMMESVSGNDTGTTTSSGVYSAAARAKSQNDNNGKQLEEEEQARPMFGVEPPLELDPETMLEGDHQKILSKLQFIYDFIETLVGVAENLSNPIAMVVEGSRRNDTSDVYRRNEQLVLYVRAMYILTSALNFSEQQITAGSLHPSPKVKHVLNQLNDKYHYCLTRSQELASMGIAGSTSVVSAEKIMYKHALDLCQSAALDELFGNPQLCPKRYQTAYMMLHTLSEQVCILIILF